VRDSVLRSEWRLTSTTRWTDTKVTAAGLSTHKVDKTTFVMTHKWPAFVGAGTPGGSRTTTLPEGNYEWPFELMLPGNTSESIEGTPEANLTYRLRATVARGVLAHDVHAHKRLRVVRTLEPSALEFLHAMSVENIWPKKVDYSIVVPTKAVVFGSSIPIEMRYTPLLKGLELGEITIRLCETQEVVCQPSNSSITRQHKKEREVTKWTLNLSREEHWQDVIGDTGQEGWVLNTGLDLPKRLGKCMQDTNVHGVKIRHKLKMVVALQNPDGHVSELRATLPVSIFLSPNMPLDDEGNLVNHSPRSSAISEPGMGAPPVYGEHILDQLYGEIDQSGTQTPAMQSGTSTPYYRHSRTGSSDDLAAVRAGAPIPPAALSSRLQDMRLNHSSTALSASVSSDVSTPPDLTHSRTSRATTSAPLTRQNSDDSANGVRTPEHIDFPDINELSKVPSYQTAVKTPARSTHTLGGFLLPDYRTAISVANSPEHEISDPLAIIREASHESRASSSSSGSGSRPVMPRRSQTYGSQSSRHGSDAADRARLLMMQRPRVF
jgi:arrestin-related trafficking adapter 4/5/7